MGQVFAAVHTETGQQVALKLLLPSTLENPQARARFLQEARVLAQLQIPGIVQIFNYGTEGDIAFLAMELLQGCSLREWMQRHSGPVSPQTALVLCKDIAAIMVEVHNRNILHRDLKPENVFLCSDPAASLGHRVKLLDFGIAKLATLPADALAGTQVHTAESTLLGTYAYMAPEQLRKTTPVYGREDVYALGVVLFELLAGRTPFVSEEPVEIVSAHLSEEPPPLKQLAPALPAALCAFVHSMLAKEPAQRPSMARCRDMLGLPWDKVREECPVPGLAPFSEAQAALFFGRQAETQTLLSRLEEARTGAKRWVQLEGPSGIGKSSLLQAGLLPRLGEPPASGSPRWLIATLRPSDQPLLSLARALVTAYANTGPGLPLDTVVRTLSNGPDEALQSLVSTHTPEAQLLLLVVDPLEELLTVGAADSQRLDTLLATALSAPECPLRLFTSVRSDFLHRLEQLPALARQLHQAARFPLLPMDEQALTQVIHGMARHAGLRLGEELAARMVADTRGEGSRLPLLGHALRELWALSEGAPVTLEHYERLGGVGGALARRAEALLDSLGPEGRERAKWLLLELVQVGRGVPDTRRPRSRGELVAAAGGDPRAEEVLLRLTGLSVGGGELEQGLRLVTLSGQEEPARQRAELVHETLLQKVPSLAGWIEQERSLLELLVDLEAAAHAWERAGCPADGPPTGTQLAHYKSALAVGFGSRPEAWRVSPLAASFLRAAERLERRRTWGRRVLVAGSVLAGLIILFSAVRAERERQTAEENLRQLIVAVDGFISGSDWKLSRLPYTLEERQKILDAYRQILDALPVRELERPEVRLARVEVYQRRADLAFHDEKLEQADHLLIEAMGILRAWREDQPLNPEMIEQWVLNASKRGKVEMARDQEERAQGFFSDALRQLDVLEQIGGVPGEAKGDFLRTKAASLSEKADAEFKQGHLKEADRFYADAIALQQETVALQKENDKAYEQHLLAIYLGERAEVALQLERDNMPKAQGYLNQARDLARGCVQAEEGDQLYQWALAQTLVRWGAFQARQEHLKEAVEAYREAAERGRAIVKGEPTHKRYVLVLVEALRALEERTPQGDERSHLHDERCRLAVPFVKNDPEDVRFQQLSCQAAPGGQ